MNSPTVRTFGCLAAILACLIAPGLPAQTPPAPGASTPPATPAAIPGLTRAAQISPAQSVPSTNKTVALKFNAAPIEQVLQFYSDLTGRTILPAPGINATITLRSQTDLTIPEAMQALKTVLAMNNVGLVETGPKFVKVVPIASVQQEGLPIQSNIWQEVRHEENDQLLSEIIPLKYIDPAEAQKAIGGLIHSYGKILPLERINSLLIADSSININRIKDVLVQIDQPLELKEKLHIMTIRHSKASDIKARLDEIIADQKEKEKQTSGRRLKETGAPGVETPTPPSIPGVIRARPAATPSTPATEQPAVEEGEMIRGTVKLIADDRTGMLIIITRPENMLFFEQIVTALDVATAPDVSVQVIRLEFADAEDIASMLNALIGAASSTKDSQPAKTAASTTGKTGEAAEPARSSQLQEFIEQQRTLATRSAKTGEAKSKVGQLSAENIKILSDKRTNALIIMASKSDMESLLDILKNMDIMLSQVLIEAVIMQINLDKTLSRGVDWVQRSMVAYNKKNGGRDPLFAFAGGGGGGTLTPRDATSLSSTFSTGGGLTYYLTQFGLNIDAVIKMSSTDNRSKILSSPVILTTDNKEAKIDVSTEKYFYKGTSYVGYSGQYQQSVPNVEARKVGLNLTVTPRINAKKLVVMEITQKIESADKKQTIAGSDGVANDWPIVDSRELTASVSVRSGETIILGGLVENTIGQDTSMIPWIGRIPILGIPFRSSSDRNLRSEIVVFITPYVLDSPEEIEAEAVRRKNSMSASQDGLWEKGWSDSKLADPPRGRVGQWWRNLLK